MIELSELALVLDCENHAVPSVAPAAHYFDCKKRQEGQVTVCAAIWSADTAWRHSQVFLQQR